ncbi:hypothetical protein VKT23_007848 [Stygiomarasmius scandens]|uniref:FAD-binding PCMH-type domain-containing protein n=1 Tax=Marasmiellus scandens TaxID=2682957 RepID=A0ABR1JN86_9AGAR
MYPRSLSKLFLFILQVSTLGSGQQNTCSIKEDLGDIRTVFPGDLDYPSLSAAYNLRYDVRPLAISFPTDTQHVSTIVKVGAANNLRVVARSGGHSYIANGLGGKNGTLVVDLSELKDIIIDPETFDAKIETGNRLGDIALALNEKGRGLPHGRCAYVGIGGHSGFGGWGFASRMWGLTLDNILSATIVLANGTITTASEDSQPDLFWGIRGSSASFGIITSISVRTHPIPSGGTFFFLFWDMDIPNASSTFSSWQSFALSSSLPTTFGGELGILKGSAYGRVQVAFLGSYFGSADQAEFNKTVEPFLSGLPEPDVSLGSTLVSGSWIEVLAAGAAPTGVLNTTMGGKDANDTFYAKSLMTPQDVPLTEEAMGALMEYLGTEGFESNTFWHVEIELYGGVESAVNAVPLNSTAFAHRNTLFTFQPYASSPNFLPPFPEEAFGFVDVRVGSCLPAVAPIARPSTGSFI